MVVHVPANSQNPAADAIKILENRPVGRAADGRRFWYEAYGRPGLVVECYENGEIFIWGFDHIDPVTPENTIPVYFLC